MISRSRHASGLARCLITATCRFPGFLGESCCTATHAATSGNLNGSPASALAWDAPSRTAAAAAPAGPSGMQIRSMSILFPEHFVTLNSIADNPGAVKKAKRVGRGPGSGLGKTCGRGHKGQKARTGRGPRFGFEGGQTPLRLALPKRGFNNRNKIEYWPVNLDRIQERIDEGRLDSSKFITMKDLQEAGIINKKVPIHGVKLLGRGAADFRHKVDLQISQVSPSAREAVERNGGTVTTVYYNKLGLRALFKPEWFAKKGRLLPRPVQRAPIRLSDRFQAVGALPPRQDQCITPGASAETPGPDSTKTMST